ncbi:MAG TPA: type II toxin-antitoxin system VapB family antitoxin [Candidatus Eisenbacteria bacterium]|nr:type II toxin-antitoxin system VapB family antitoxin [Candidatus Eisenbacteria bacterium]
MVSRNRLLLSEAMVTKSHTTLDLDRELLESAATALGTTRTTDTVHAALREVVARRRRRYLAERDFSELDRLLPSLRAPRAGELDEPRNSD